MINKVILVGNLGKDPELRTVANGTVIANFNVATTDRRKDKDGNWADQTEWHRIVCFGKTAEFVGSYLKKGRQVYVEGKIQTRTWEKDGVKQYSTEILADKVNGLGPKPKDADTGSDQGYSGTGADEEIPF